MKDRRYGSPETRQRANRALAERNQKAGVRAVRLPADVIAGLDAIALTLGIPRTDVAASALREWLAGNPNRNTP